jgi:D-proline reductase (dithiol) PrdB
VGLIARTIEAAGIPTVCLIGLREIAEKVRPPRAVHLKWPFGHPLGEPEKPLQQLQVLYCALEALYTIREPGTILDPPWPWRRTTYHEITDWRLPREGSNPVS